MGAVVGERRLYEAWLDYRYVDVVTEDVETHAFEESCHSGLACTVCRGLRQPAKAREARYRDEMAALSFLHRRQHGVDHIDCAEKVDVDDLFDRRRFEIACLGVVSADACVGDGDVDVPELIPEGLGGLLECRGIGHVAWESPRLTAGFLALRLERIQ